MFRKKFKNLKKEELEGNSREMALNPKYELKKKTRGDNREYFSSYRKKGRRSNIRKCIRNSRAITRSFGNSNSKIRLYFAWEFSMSLQANIRTDLSRFFF